MNLRTPVLFIALAMGCGLTARAATAAPAPGSIVKLRRFAVVASANDGGTGRTRLRFAESDARAVATVLGRMGGVNDTDLVILANTSRASLHAAFDKVRGLMVAQREPGVRAELLLYYSGHSDEDGLLLGSERVSYLELRHWIEETSADVRIAILDSCASGALLRAKGGVHRTPFLTDSSTQARGHAFLTASSADEAAQESDRIGAAFFTHYLVTGLRGAADANRDQRITLNEAYQFAYAETLKRTETSRGGAQHAAYDIQLTGTGDLVMTDLRSASSHLVLDDKLAGRLYVRDGRGVLLAEIRKEPLYPVELGLEAGHYRIVLDADGRGFEAEVALTDGGRTVLRQPDFRQVALLATTARGNGSSDANEPALSAAITMAPGERVYRDVPFDLVLAPGARLLGRGPEPVRHRFVLGLVSHSDALRGLQLSLAGNIVQDDMRGAQFTSGFNLTYGSTVGVQGSGLANIAMGDMKGAQLGGLVNVAWADFKGAQLGGIANVVQGDFRGFQGSVVNGVNGSGVGAQAAVINATRGHLRGAQMGVVNVAGELQGAQLSVINVGGRVSGTQIGVINVARELDGAQIGVVNFARQGRGASIGVIPIVLNGRNVLTAWSSDVSLSNVGVKLGTQHFYTLFGFGATNGTRDSRETLLTYTAGLGGHIVPGAGRLYLDIDGLISSFNSKQFSNQDDNVTTGLRLMVGYQIARHFAVFGGPTYNVQVSMNGKDYRRGTGFAESIERSGDTTVRRFPGFAIGVEL